MLRGFIQIIRSGVVGRRSFGYRPKKLIREWLASRSADQLFRDSVGNDPSLVDIIKMVHPKPESLEKEALYGYLLNGGTAGLGVLKLRHLPELVQEWEIFKASPAGYIASYGGVPDVPFLMLTGMSYGEYDEVVWRQIALNATWTQTRMNLNAFARHGVFKDSEVVAVIADRLRNRSLIAKAKVFPYQLLIAYLSTGSWIPPVIREALQDALEIATENVPAIKGKVYVCPDVSGSMSSSITGYRRGATSKVECVDVAALYTACILRNNPYAGVIPFEGKVVHADLNPRDTVITNAEKLKAVHGGSTNASAPLALLNKRGAKGDAVIYISDNESWVETASRGRIIGVRSRATAMMEQWSLFRKRNPNAKLVCIDLQPYSTTQAPDLPQEILNVGGFSDTVFNVVARFLNDKGTDWVDEIEHKVIL